MGRTQYIQKVKELLEDKETYIPINTNPIQKLDDMIKRTVNDLIMKSQITKEEWRWMKISEPVLPCFYDYPKIHKTNIPLTPIIMEYHYHGLQHIT